MTFLIRSQVINKQEKWYIQCGTNSESVNDNTEHEAETLMFADAYSEIRCKAFEDNCVASFLFIVIT